MGFIGFFGFIGFIGFIGFRVWSLRRWLRGVLINFLGCFRGHPTIRRQRRVDKKV